MAATPITIDNVASVGTAEKKISSETNPGSDGIAVAANEAVTISCAVSAHATDTIYAKIYRSAQISGVTKWFLWKTVPIAAGNSDEVPLVSALGGGPYDIGFYASGSTDNPTVTITAKKEAVN